MIGLSAIFSYIRLRRCCRLPSLVTKTKTVARNEVESGFKKGTSIVQIYAVSPQGKLKKRNGEATRTRKPLRH